MSQLIRLAVVAVILSLSVAPVEAASSPKLSGDFRLWREGAAQGRPLAQFYMGLAYAMGRGTYPDHAAAYMWFSLAAAQGEPHAMKSLSRLKQRMTAEQKAAGERMLRLWSLHPREILGRQHPAVTND